MIQACMLILHELLDGLRAACGAIPDKRKGDDGTYTMTDIGLSAFSLFFMQSESFLSYQRSLEEGRKTSNCHTLFGMAKIPRQSHPVDARPGSSFASAILVRSSGCGAAGEGRHERVPAPWRPRADRPRRNRIFLFVQARLSALPDAQALEWKDRILPLHVGDDHRRAGPQHGRAPDAG